MRIEKNSGALPSWLDSFVNKIQNKKVATKNVKNLPTVTWKNETYYVNLTDDGAVLYNDQANEVMSMDGVKSIEQVNDELNKDSVVASKTKLADDGNDSTDSQTITKDDGSGDVEASKSNYFDLDKTAENEDMPTDNGGMESEIGGFGVPTDQIQSTTASINEGVEDVSGEPHKGIDDISGEPHETIEEAGTDKYQHNANDGDVVSEEAPSDTDNFVSKASYNRLLAKVKKLEKKISAMDKKADDWSGDAGSTGFQDIGNAISDGVGAVGDAIGNAFDWAQQQSQGENGIFDSRNSKKDVKCKHHLIADIPEGGINMTDLPGYDESVSGDDMSNMRIMPSEPPSNDADSRDFNNAEQFGGIFGKKKRKAYTEAQHAYTSPENDAYDLNSQDEEVKHFNESEKATKKVIDREHELDLSKMSDRAKLNEYFLDDIDKETDVVDEALNDVPSHDELVDMVEQDPQGAGEEEIDTPEVEDEVIKVDDETPTDEVEIETDAPVEEVVEELPDDEKAVVVEEEPTDMPVIVTLDSPDDVDKFVNQQCPICNAKKSLQGIQKVANLTGVVCKHCGQEYAVGNDHIYLKK